MPYKKNKKGEIELDLFGSDKDLFREREYGIDKFGLTTTKRPKTIKLANQHGQTNINKDLKRLALPPGKRISKSGKVYWETRTDRSDLLGRRV